MKNLVWILLVAAIAAIAFVVVSDRGSEVPETAEETSRLPSDPADLEAPIALSPSGGETTEARTAVERASAEAAKVAEGVADGATELLNNSGASIAEATDDASNDAAGVVQDVLENAEITSSTPTTGATESPGAVDVLTAEQFDPAAVAKLIDESNLGLARKATLKAAIERAAGNPAVLQATLDQVRTALGL